MANYSPTFLPTFSKLQDKLVNIAQVSDYLENKAILNTAQHGFRCSIHARRHYSGSLSFCLMQETKCTGHV